MTLTIAVCIGIAVALLAGIPRWLRYRQDQDLIRLVAQGKARAIDANTIKEGAIR